ncbi:MAG TPA: DUF4230 domain-containing protein, partial [Bacteroidota bacterium]|nr:DUF4230 domain-containing protein [Bacteroidota bacterium]
LPAPEILMSRVDHGQSKVYDVTWGGFSTAELVDAAYKNAELSIIDEAAKTGYDETCRKNACALLTPIFQQISGKEVSITFKSM